MYIMSLTCTTHALCHALNQLDAKSGGGSSKCIGKKSATKKIPGLRLEIESCFVRVPELVCRLNGVQIKLVSCFATSFSNLILSCQARISILTIPPRNISSSFFFLLRQCQPACKRLERLRE